MTTHELANLLESLNQGMASCLTTAARKAFAEAAEDLRAAPETPIKKLAAALTDTPAKPRRPNPNNGNESTHDAKVEQAANWYLNVRDRIVKGEPVNLDKEMKLADVFVHKVLQDAFSKIGVNFKAGKKRDLLEIVRNTLKGLQLDQMRGDAIRSM